MPPPRRQSLASGGACTPVEPPSCVAVVCGCRLNEFRVPKNSNALEDTFGLCRYSGASDSNLNDREICAFDYSCNK